MKHEFDTPALRQTAEEIQGAVRAKSITADMVGGTLLALVNATGEMVEVLGELKREHVTVKVQAYDGTQRVSVAGAKVYVDMFSIGGVPTVSLPRQELAVDENGEVSFDVVKGYQYAVFSKLDGMGASFQFTYEACQDERTIDLWHFPIGVYMVGVVNLYDDSSDKSRVLPFITESYIDDWEERQVSMGWDIQGDEYVDDGWYEAILVSTENTAFAIEPSAKSTESKTWSGSRYYGKSIPMLPTIYPDEDAFGDWDAAWNDAQSRARADYDGNLNTAKILAFYKNADAAEFCANVNRGWNRQMFLPSAGQLYLIYLNKAAIDALMVAANADGWEFDVLTKDYNWYWSSTQSDEWCAWYVYMSRGSTYDGNKSNGKYVRAVSAFHFIY